MDGIGLQKVNVDCLRTNTWGTLKKNKGETRGDRKYMDSRQTLETYAEVYELDVSEGGCAK